ncbi:MAG: LacI family DNA-binding transcriptional regulator [Rhodobacteraceae bacterium]|nr:LacI family DNA-binding transcriptional regulator [Paracoccaceae bacterium]PHR56237.1 MAG: LacI family transcriptional regulator [Robiginitomaculum sp.]
MSQHKIGKTAPARVTILDIARVAGVSKSSVSRSLDERLPRSNSESAQRVRRVAQELGYVRDVSAASLRRGKTGMIGVIVPRLTDTVMAMLYESLQRAAARSGHFAIVATTDDTPEAGQRAATTLLKRGVDGLVLSIARIDDPFIFNLRERGVPHVLALRTDGHSPSSIGDDELGGYLATRHLLDLGHRHIGIIAGPSYASSALGRLEGYRRALIEADIEYDLQYVTGSSFGIEAGARAAKQLLGLDTRPTAIFAVNDNTAIGAVSALGEMGLSIPDDISVVGYNDIPIVSKLPVPLTSVHVPFDQIAVEAMDLLLSDEAASPREFLRKALPSLMPRKSTRSIW